MVDKITKKTYILQENIKYAGINATNSNLDQDEDERDSDEERELVDAAFLSEFDDLGWEGRIVSQFIMSKGAAKRGSTF